MRRRTEKSNQDDISVDQVSDEGNREKELEHVLTFEDEAFGDDEEFAIFLQTVEDGLKYGIVRSIRR